jgi:hypothetical protein
LFKIYDGREAFYQWDVEQKIVVDDRSITQVHFCNRTDDCALICECYEHEGKWVADVPNILLQDNWRIRVYAYDGCATKHEQRYDVIARSKPDTYVYTETEVLSYETIKKQMDAITNDIEGVVRDYLEENPIDVDLTGYATEVYVDEALAAFVVPDAAISLASGVTIDDPDVYAQMLTIYQTNKMDNVVFINGIQMLTAVGHGSIGFGSAEIYFYGFKENNEKLYPVCSVVKLKNNTVTVDGTLNVEFDGYATETFVNNAIEQIELTPGPAGKDGVDGKDGYTPIKGVDYFDGQDGKDGQDGAPGADGKDYVLTEADKQEIASMVEVTGGDGESIKEVHVGTGAPTDPSVKLWVNPDEEVGFATKQYVDDAVSSIEIPDVDLTGYATEKYVDDAIANIEIPEGGGGGSVAVDGTSIIQNDDGTISTVVGGSRVIAEGETAKIDYTSDTGFTKANTNNARYASKLSNYLSSLDTNTKYTVELEYRNANTNETGSCVGYMIYSGANLASWTCYDLAVFDDEIQSMDYGSSSQGIFLTGAKSGASYYQVYYITKFKIIAPPVYDYEPINAKFIPIGSGLYVNVDGQLTAELDHLYLDDKHNLYNETNLNDYNTGSNCVALGYSNTLMNLGNGKVALGRDNSIYGSASVALGDANKYGNSSGYGHVMVGYNNSTKQTHALAVGGYLIAASAEQCVYGKYNIEDSASTYNTIIGNGNSSTRANGLTINGVGDVVTQGTISNGGADYAEYFEWADGNPNSEDRVGLLVTLDGNKIRYAKAIDDVLGVVSGTATVLGDDAEWVWQGKYLRDDFGRVIMEDVEIALDEEKTEFTTVKAPKINPEYDESKPYVSRANRPEWDAIGMMGKLFVKDDGTCVVNGYAMPGENGLATSATGKTNIRVMERINENIIRVLLK